MAVVLDCSVVASLCFADEDRDAVGGILDRIGDEGAVVPSLWWFEIRNVLLMGERRKRITAEESAEFLAELDRLPIEIDREPASDSVLALARRFDLTAYDAAYLELSVRRAAPLATLDEKLAAAARRVKVKLVI